jgi:alpha-amylase
VEAIRTLDTGFTVVLIIAVALIPDLWDLGEFDQKGIVATKYGLFDDLIALLSVAKQHGMFMYYDAVLNHKAWADEPQQCNGIQVDWNG